MNKIISVGKAQPSFSINVSFFCFKLFISIPYEIQSPLTTTAIEQIAVKPLCRAHAVLVVDGFEAEFGGGEVELVDVACRGVGVNHDVDALSLVDVFLSLRGLLDDGELTDFGKGFVDFFFFVIEGCEVLYGAVVEQNAFPGFFVVEFFFLQQFYQERVFVGGFDFGEVFDVVVGFEGFY